MTLEAKQGPRPKDRRLCAGTSTSRGGRGPAHGKLMGCRVEAHYDVGWRACTGSSQGRVHRKADALVVAAGMEGALPSVVAGLVGAPLIAVPTSVGYGASFKGLSALLTMMNSCAPGVAVVNIDNGFGAGYLAARIARRGA